MTFEKQDEIDYKLVNQYCDRVTVNTSLYDVTYQNKNNYSGGYLRISNSDKKSGKKDDCSQIDNEISKTIADKESIEEKIIALYQLSKKINLESNGRKTDFYKKKQDRINSKIKYLINPNRMYERLGVDIISLHIGQDLITIVDSAQGSDLMVKTVNLRKKLTDILGFIIPNIRIADFSEIKPNEYEIFIRGRKVFIGELSEEDINNKNCDKIIEDLKNICIKYVHQIMTKTDVLKLIELVKSQNPTLINDLVPVFLSPIDLKKIFANLISQNISIKGIVFIFEILNDHARFTRDIDELTQFVKDELNFVKE